MFNKLYKNNKTGSFAAEPFTDDYVELTKKELKWVNEHGTESFKLTNEGFVINPDYPAEKAKKEREQLDMLFLTATDVERAIYRTKGIDFDGIYKQIEELAYEGKIAIDLGALKIELKANNFYRGNPYINEVGEILGYSSDDLDYLFQTGKFPEEDEEDNASASNKDEDTEE